MPKLKANALVIKSALKEGRADYTIEGHPGLYLEARGDGSGSWILRYRVEGKQREKTLHNDAKHADFQRIANAKDEWRMAAKVQGRDLQAERDAEIAAKRKVELEAKLTLRIVIDEWIAKPRARVLRPQTVKLYRWIFDAYVVPVFGDRPIVEITKPELAVHFAKLRERLQREGGRNGAGTRGEGAGKAFTYLTAVFDYAFAQEYIGRSPMLGLDRPVPKEPERKRSRPPRPDEVRKIWHGADSNLEPAFARMIKLALLLGRRRSEIAGAEVAELHLDDPQPHWVIPPRSGNKSALPSLVPLPSTAVRIFREAIADQKQPSVYVFPKMRAVTDASTNPDSLSHAWANLCEAVGVPRESTLHDARGLITDALEVMGVPDNIVSHVLHHTADMRSTTAKRVYSTNSFRPEKLRALRLWQARLRNIVSGKKLHLLRWHA